MSDGLHSVLTRIYLFGLLEISASLMSQMKLEENIRSCLPEDYTDSQYDDKDLEMLIGLSITLGFFLVELIGFMGGITMFMPFQGLLSTVAHSAAAIALSYFLFDQWPCEWYWYVFGFCSAFPALMEVIYIVGILCFRKGY
ncbi:hypothetical protein PoB_003468200 [Plakobranchus ocellatus]|uniref:Transmembrane protein 107 n=1 Tax=Plakobranchus ocellatus TaxID=259542 RepID=A0AAV4AMH6_9GAST|nr:hypothetical protein PoB_003468200 [Plakobranchus ocellatus]